MLVYVHGAVYCVGICQHAVNIIFKFKTKMNNYLDLPPKLRVSCIPTTLLGLVNF